MNVQKDKVKIFDTTLRDGEQSAGAGLTKDEKLEIAKQLEILKVDVIEAGFAASSPGDFDAVQSIAETIKNCEIASLARANPDDIDQGWNAIKNAVNPRIHVFISSSDIHILHQLRRNREQVVEMAVDMVKRAKKYCSNVEFSPMDATRTGTDFLFLMLEEVIRAGATTVNIADTVGYAIPSQFSELIGNIKNKVEGIDDVTISVHCHNDLGLSSSNSLAAVEAGARQVEGCINGIGERAGNAALEEIIVALKAREDHFGVQVNIDTKQLYPTSRLVSRLTGFNVQLNKAIVGGNAFRHASGIHQDGLLKERTTYELIDPVDVGWPGSSLVLGKLSGRSGLKSRLQELGYVLEQEELNRIFTSFKNLADKKREVTDRDLEALMAEEKRIAVEEVHFKLVDLTFDGGINSTPVAKITLESKTGEKTIESAEGTGPVDAVCKAIRQAVGIEVKLVDYKVESITEGLDSLGDVTVRLEKDDNVYSGRGTSTDIVEASALAYLAAINRLCTIENIVS